MVAVLRPAPFDNEGQQPVSVYFASDMHLRLDRPDRGRRLARWVDGLACDDGLYLVGDVCDFWYVSRQRQIDPMACDGLRSLANFRRRGGDLKILLGNHDHWLGPFYQQVLGARIMAEPLIVEAGGLRLHLVHGHRAGGRRLWKTGMESRAFLELFERLPDRAANRLDRLLDQSNGRSRSGDEARHVEIYRQGLSQLPAGIDIAVFGHVHEPLDENRGTTRLVVLGGWHHGTSYLRVDDQGATLVVEPEVRTALV